MKARATLDVSCSDQDARRSLVSVLTPDNEGGPRGLSIELRGSGRQVQVKIGAETAATAASTCLAFLRDVALFQEVWLLSHRKPARVQRSDPK